MRNHLTLCLLSALCLVSGHAFAAEFEADHNGLTVSSDDGENELSFGGRLHYDVAQFDDDVTPLADDNDIRRLRLSLSGRFLDDWRFKLERDVGGTSDGWKNAWLGYSGIQHWNFKAGNMTAPVGMEQTYGSNDMPLMERSLSAALAPGFLTGAQARYDRRGWTAALGYFTNPIDQELGDAGAEGDGFAGRVTYAPLRKKGKVLHVGTSYQRRSIDDTYDPVTNPDDGFRLRARPGSGLADRTLVDTGIIPGVDGTSTWGVELAAVAGPVSFLAERLQMRVNRVDQLSLDFSGWHATAAWALTGESRRYFKGSGVMGGIRPNRKWGAIELALRYDQLDLDDEDVLGGQERNLTYGVNWYLGRNFRLMFDHVEAELDPNRNGIKEDVGITQLRAQVNF